MLWCATAFLLIAGKSSNRLDRLVVATDEVDKPSYGVYEVKGRDYFPHSEFIDHFMLTKTKITEKGTYYMSYCSDYLKSVEIASIITEGLTDITYQAHVGLAHDTKMEKKCLTYLSSISKLGPEQSVIDLSKCEKKVRKMCTSRIILDLAFKGIIAVDGPYKAFAPRMADQLIVVTHDQPLDMSSLFLNGETFARSGTELEQNALAWYQGHLHLFKQNLKTSEWTPVTQIGSEVNNGPLITNHVLEALPDSKLQWTRFYKMKEEITRPYNPWNLQRSWRYDSYSQEIYNFLNSDERNYDHLIHTYPFLNRNYRNPISRFHESLRYYFDNYSRILHQIFWYSEKLSHQKLMPHRTTGTMSQFEEKVITEA